MTKNEVSPLQTVSQNCNRVTTDNTELTSRRDSRLGNLRLVRALMSTVTDSQLTAGYNSHRDHSCCVFSVVLRII